MPQISKAGLIVHFTAFSTAHSCSSFCEQSAVRLSLVKAKSVSGSGASTKSLGTAASTKTLGGNSSGAEGSTDGAGGGWSFSGEEYVPEDYDSGDTWDTSFVDATEENSKGESWADKTITINIPLGRIFYTGMGGILVLVIEGIIWVIRKKRKERLISQ